MDTVKIHELSDNEINRIISGVSVGDMYKSKADMYRTLGMQYQRGRNGQLADNILKRYIHWCSVRDNSFEIIIDAIYPIPLQKPKRGRPKKHVDISTS